MPRGHLAGLETTKSLLFSSPDQPHTLYQAESSPTQDTPHPTLDFWEQWLQCLEEKLPPQSVGKKDISKQELKGEMD